MWWEWVSDSLSVSSSGLLLRLTSQKKNAEKTIIWALNIQLKVFPYVLIIISRYLSSVSFRIPSTYFPCVSLLAALSPSAATLLWRCSTPLYGSTLISLCCPRPCSTSSALQPRSSLACCPVLCPSSLSCPWRRSESHRFLAIVGWNLMQNMLQ